MPADETPIGAWVNVICGVPAQPVSVKSLAGGSPSRHGRRAIVTGAAPTASEECVSPVACNLATRAATWLVSITGPARVGVVGADSAIVKPDSSLIGSSGKSRILRDFSSRRMTSAPMNFAGSLAGAGAADGNMENAALGAESGGAGGAIWAAGGGGKNILSSCANALAGAAASDSSGRLGSGSSREVGWVSWTIMPDSDMSKRGAREKIAVKPSARTENSLAKATHGVRHGKMTSRRLGRYCSNREIISGVDRQRIFAAPLRRRTFARRHPVRGGIFPIGVRAAAPET